jgi:alkanesulfonate monooxygenase SsuD/methylene tetrahydromethanopterin reductase-like flavin-dependent oxidoreductase (luciferase family)
MAAMQFGAHFAPIEGAADVREIGRMLEAAGFESLFIPEHTHKPVGGNSVHPSGAQMHDRLTRLFDPLISLTAVAASTTRLRLGTGVLLVPLHDPILLAKQVATLDALSGGRGGNALRAGGGHRRGLREQIVRGPRLDRARGRQDCLTRFEKELAKFRGQRVEDKCHGQFVRAVERPRGG